MLKDRLKKVAAKKRAERPPPPPSPETPAIPAIPRWYDVPVLASTGDEFPLLVRKRQYLDAEIKKLTAQKEDVSGQVQLLLELSSFKSVEVEHWTVTRSEGRKGSRKIDGKKLLKAGVTADVIARCTVTGKPGRPYIIVTEIGGKAGAEETEAEE